MTKKMLLVVAAWLLPLLLISCSGSGTQADRGINEQILYVGNQTEPEDLDPHIITGTPEFHIILSLFEGLVVLDPKDLRPMPGVARSWESSNDAMLYTFHLRSNARWSNGDPVTANDFVFSFKRILTPSLASEYSYMLYPIKGAEAFNKGKLSDFSQVGAKALDDTTLQITLERPTPYFLSLIAHSSWIPVHRPTIEKYGAADKRGTQWTRPGNMVCNGAFTLEKWEINNEIVVRKSETYWNKDVVHLKGIHFYAIENQQTEERSFRTGQLLVTSSLPPNKIEWYKANKPQCLRIDPFLTTYFYLVNVGRKPLDDPRVRKALSYAIDRKAITEHVLKGGQMPATCFTPLNTAGYSCTTSIGFDTTAARKLFADAGYGPGKPFPKISLLYNTNEAHQQIAQAVQQMWKLYLGIDVTLVNQEWKVYLNSTHSKDYDIARMGWTGDYNDPTTFLDMWVTGGGNNRTGWSNPAYDSLLSAASHTADRQRRFGYFQEAEKILLDQMPIMPIYFYTNVYLLNPAVKGWGTNLLNYQNYTFIYLQK